MKVLLLGEYSGVYTELSKGFRALGHDSFTLSDGDSYKKYKSDYVLKVDMPHPSNFMLRVYRHLLFRFGLDGLIHFYKIWPVLKKKIEGFDVVLFINPIVFNAFGSIPNYILANYVKKHNKAIYLSVLGDDYYVQKYFEKNHLQNNFYKRKIKDIIKPSPQLKYRYCFFYKTLNKFLLKHSTEVLPGTFLYAKAYSFSSKVSNIFPFPIAEDKLGKPIVVNHIRPIIIFHGWQLGKDSRKGNAFFDKIIKKVVDHYGKDKVEYHVVFNVPYDEYVKLFSNCHIFIDQLYASDKGVNGLLGMAAGKVVFSGFKKDILINTYKGYSGEVIGIESYEDEDYLFNKFCSLIDNPGKIEEISCNAINFVKRYHLSTKVASEYIKVFNKYPI